MKKTQKASRFTQIEHLPITNFKSSLSRKSYYNSLFSFPNTGEEKWNLKKKKKKKE